MSGYSVRKISDLAADYGEAFVRNVIAGFSVFASRKTIENGYAVEYDQLFMFLK